MATAYKLRFVPIGGIVGVTKNMYCYELYKDNELKDILLVDCGIGFPKVQEFGVDFEIPDITYLEDKVDKIRGLMLTHAHEDHISAVRFHYNKLGRPRIYTTKLTSLFVQNKAKEQGVKLDVEVIDFRKSYVLGGFDVKFIRMTHSIPDTTQLLIKTPVGAIYHGCDYKIDLTPPFGYGPDFYEIAKAGKEGVLCFLSDSLGSDRPGFTASESVVGKSFEDEIRTTKGMFLMTTFASNISRVRQCAEAALKFNRKICLLGRSLVTNTGLVKDLGYFPIPESHIISEKDLKKYKPHEICIIATGSQGQYGSAMARIAMGEHRFVQVKKGDKVVFSSDPIPGNEEQVNELIEHLYLQEADVKYNKGGNDLHTSGHGSQGDMLLMMRMLNAKYLIPIGGTVLFQRHYRDLARRMNYRDEDVFLLGEGQTVEFENGKAKLGKKILTKNVYVDAYGVGDVGEVILRDRQTLATEGFVFIVVKVDSQGKLISKPECVSRGFVYGKGKGADRDKIFEGAGDLIDDMFKAAKGAVPLHRDMITKLERYFEKQTNKQPLVVVEVLKL